MTREKLLEEIENVYKNVGIIKLEDLGFHFGYRDPKGFRKLLKDFDLYENLPDVTPQLKKKLRLFENLNALSSYWLGYIAADGCITETRLMLECQVSDKKILEKFCKVLDVRTERITSGQKGTSSCLCLSKSSFITFPDEYGIRIRKSSLQNRVDQRIMENKEFFFQFIRGFLDGDGTVHTHRSSIGVSFCGDKTMLSDIRDGLMSYIDDPESIWLFEITKPGRKQELWELKIGAGVKRRMIKELYTNMYLGQEIVLERKHKKFLELLS